MRDGLALILPCSGVALVGKPMRNEFSKWHVSECREKPCWLVDLLRRVAGAPRGRLAPCGDAVASNFASRRGEEHEKCKPEIPHQYGIHLDSKLTSQTRRRYTSTESSNIEELRAKSRVMSHVSLLVQFHQPRRALIGDLPEEGASRV